MLLGVILLVLFLAEPTATHAGIEMRTLVVRERAIAGLLDGAFTFRLLKIMGYSVEVRFSGKNRVLKIGQSFSPTGSDCTIVFEEIATETRIARFITDCH